MSGDFLFYALAVLASFLVGASKGGLPMVSVLGVPLLALAYFTQGIVRAATEHGLSGRIALAETALAVVLFVSAALYTRTSRKT